MKTKLTSSLKTSGLSPISSVLDIDLESFGCSCLQEKVITGGPAEEGLSSQLKIWLFDLEEHSAQIYAVPRVANFTASSK